MTKVFVRSLWLVGLSLVPVGAAQAQPRTLDVYWIDVEGGARKFMALEEP